MRIYIFADMEGCSGITGKQYVGGDRAQLGCDYMLGDVNACVAGCFKAGATEALVRDGHCSGVNLDLGKLDPRAELIAGCTPRERFADLDGCDALILLGYHAMAGTADAVLEHTYSSGSVQNMWINGRKAGEFAFDAAIAAERGVPTILVTGDDKVCAEARTWLSEVVTCQVKKSYNTGGARVLPLQRARALIEAKTIEAVNSIPRTALLRLDLPITLRREFVERVDCPADPAFTQLDARTYEVSGNSLESLMLFNR